MKKPRSAPPKKTVRQIFARGEHWLFVTGAALAIALLMIAGLLFVVAKNGIGYFWIRDLVQVARSDGPPLLGNITAQQEQRTDAKGTVLTEAQMQVRVAGRDVFGADFVWVPINTLGEKSRPADAVHIERWQGGDLFGFIKSVSKDGTVVAEGDGAFGEFQKLRAEAAELFNEFKRIQKDDIGKINIAISKENENIRRARRVLEGAEEEAAIAAAEQRIEQLKQNYEVFRVKAEDYAKRAAVYTATIRMSDGQEKEIQLADVFAAFTPNQMSVWDKFVLYLKRVGYFIVGEPRESNTEGGVWPALFGTVMMTLLLSVAVTPFGVLAALYLREYAKQGPLVRTVRIAINNLAGVPSIVFGVFGLGFFVYFVGGWVDQQFFPDATGPTFGTGGIFWASLTLALLTVPVVIVATEESLAAVPRGVREGSLALGASKFQTICNVVLPAAVPGILTGVILAMARGAGEVAPLMITGVVKLAAEMPFDATEPYLHLDRKFMHLGFHIYDVGFQSPNVEAAKPMVFATTLLLIAIVIMLNIVAIRTRDRIRKKFQGGAFG